MEKGDAERCTSLHRSMLKAIDDSDLNGLRRAQHLLYDPESTPLQTLFSEPCRESFAPVLDAALYGAYKESEFCDELKLGVTANAASFGVEEDKLPLLEEAFDKTRTLKSASKEEHSSGMKEVRSLLDEAGFKGIGIRTVSKMKRHD